MESKTVSNEFHELQYVAAKLGCSPSLVLKAKEHTGSNDRETIENFIKDAQLLTLEDFKKLLKILDSEKFSPENVGELFHLFTEVVNNFLKSK